MCVCVCVCVCVYACVEILNFQSIIPYFLQSPIMLILILINHYHNLESQLTTCLYIYQDYC